MGYYEELTGGKAPSKGPSYYQELTQGPQTPLPFGGGAVVDSPDASAGFWANMRASLAPDDKDKIKRYSSAMGVPVERFGIVKGNIVYLDDNNKLVRVTPSVEGGSGVADMFTRAGDWLASQFGPALPGTAAAVTGTVMGPTGLSIPAAGGAAAVTDVVRQGVDRVLAGEDVTDIDLMNSVGHGLMSSAGQGASVLASKLLNKNPMGVSRFEQRAATDPARIRQAEEMQRLARRHGVDLTPGEATGLRSVLATERQLGRHPATADTMYDFASNRKAGQVIPAVEGQLAKISPDPATVGVERLREGASAAIEAAKAERKRIAKPFYDAVVKLDNVIPDERFKDIAADPFLKGQLKAIRSNPLYAKEFPKDAPDASLPVVDAVKKKIDGMIKEAARTGNANKVRLLSERRDALLSVADEIFPDYPAARRAFAGLSPEVDALTKGIVGKAARETTDNAANRAAAIFGSRDPMAIATARNAFEKAGRLDDWNAGLKAYLADHFDRAVKTLASGETGNVAGKFHAAVFGDPTAVNAIKSAMGPQQFKDFEALMKVLNAAGRGLQEGSPTATDLLAEKARGSVAWNLRKVVGLIASPHRWGTELMESGERAASVRATERLAEAVVSPDNLRLIRSLRMLDPKSEAAMVITNHILTNAGLMVSGARTPADVAVPALESTTQRPQ